MRIISTFFKKGCLPLCLLSILFLSIAPIAHSQNYPVSDFDPQLQQVIAFPGAEGFGKFATGGRGGQVIKVTNLNDGGPGSLRAAVESHGPRIIVFEVSGTIELKSTLTIRSSNSNVTIAGQTAPGDGITLRNYPLVIHSAKNVILRHIRSRMGDLTNFIGDALTIRKDNNQASPENIIVDHCSFSWGTDETMSIGNGKNISVQNCIISEGLNQSVHDKGAHGYGGIISGQNISIYNNLISHFVERNFQFQTGTDFTRDQSLIDFRNNVVYNWSHRANDGGAESNINLMDNYYKAGPASFKGGNPDYYMNATNIDGKLSTYGLFYLEGNKLEHKPAIENDQWAGVRLQSGDLTDKYLYLTQHKDNNGKLVPFPIPEGIYSAKRTANQAFQSVIGYAGVSLNRDAVDNRIVQEARDGKTTFKGSKTGLLGIIDSQKDVGGWPVLKSLPALVDSDGDGIPDSWETANKLDPKSANDREYNLSPYYTDIEVYINSLLIAQQIPEYPNQAELVLPNNNESISPLDLSFAWKPINNAISYQIQISKSSTFSSNVISINNIKTYSLVYPELDANSTYYWRVRASNSSGIGTYSTVRTFKTGSKNISPTTTLLLSPVNQKAGVSLNPVYYWAKVPNSDSYQIQVSDKSDFSNLIINQSNLTTNQYQSPKLKENSSYYWRVRAKNDYGTGSYSSTGSFKTLSLSDLPKPVVPISPINQAHVSPVNINFKWLEESSAETYQVQISTDFYFSNLIFNRSTITGTLLEIPKLDQDKTYYWRIRGKNRSGTGRYSAVNQFRTGLPIAQEEIPINSDSDIINLLKKDLVGYWPMDEGSGNRMMDQSGKGNNATIVDANGVSWKEGVVNKAISLNGNSGKFGRVSHNSSLAIPNALTISAWVKPSVMGRSSIISKSDSNGNGFELWLDLNGQIVFRLNRGKDSAAYRILSNFNYSNSVGKWFHITATFDGNNSIIYINGKEDISRTYNAFGIGTNSGDMVIGAIGSIQRFRGEMDELRLYERAFSKLEIPYLIGEIPAAATTIQTQTVSDLVGHWKMNEGNGNLLIDHSGMNNDATIIDTNGVNWVTGVEGLALSLDGGTGRYGTVNHHSSLVINNAITIAAWVNPKLVGRNTVISKSDGNGFELTFNNDGIIDFHLNRTDMGGAYRLRSKYNYSNDVGKWIHVAATFDGTKSTIYINGIEDVSRTYAPFTIGTSSESLSIAALGKIQRFNGSIDDLRLYNKALPTSEILKLASISQTMRVIQGGSKNNPISSEENTLQAKASIVPENMEERSAPILYPNPAESWIRVMSLWQKEGKIKGQVYDMKGVLLMEEELELNSSNIEIDLSSLKLKTGNYMLILQDAQHREVLRFVKK
jgi:hypothetical protein